MLGVGDVWNLGEARVGGGRWNGHNETILGEIGEVFGCWRGFQRRLVFYLGLFSSGADHNCKDNPDIRPFPYQVFHSAIPTGSSKSRFLSLCYLSVRAKFFVHKRTFDPTVQNPSSENSLRRRLDGRKPTAGEKKKQHLSENASAQVINCNHSTRCSLAPNISAIRLYFVHHCVLPRLFFMSACPTMSFTPTHFTFVP